MKTLRLQFPRWQGGITSQYWLGSQILNVIVPAIPGQIVRDVNVDTNFQALKQPEAGIGYYQTLQKQNKQVKEILNETKPEAIVTIGGDCSVSQLPFEYLLEKYKDQLGIIWLDAHTDSVEPGHSDRLHEMPLGNLLGQGDSLELTRANTTVRPDHVLLAGVIDDEIPEANQTKAERSLLHLNPEQLKEHPESLTEWMQEQELKYIAIHWDLDVLSPLDYRSILTAQPGTSIEEYDFPVGRMKLADVADLFEQVQQQAQIVGLTIAEPVNWDADRLRQTLMTVKLFEQR